MRAEGGWREMGEQHLSRGTMLGREARFKVLKLILRDHRDNPMDDREVMVGKQDDMPDGEVLLNKRGML